MTGSLLSLLAFVPLACLNEKCWGKKGQQAQWEATFKNSYCWGKAGLKEGSQVGREWLMLSLASVLSQGRGGHLHRFWPSTSVSDGLTQKGRPSNLITEWNNPIYNMLHKDAINQELSLPATFSLLPFESAVLAWSTLHEAQNMLSSPSPSYKYSVSVIKFFLCPRQLLFFQLSLFFKNLLIFLNWRITAL